MAGALGLSTNLAGGAPDDTAELDNGREVTIGPGDLCFVPPGHDFEVVVDEPYTSLHFHGAEEYGAVREGAREPADGSPSHGQKGTEIEEESGT